MTTEAIGWRSWLPSGDLGRFWPGRTISNLGMFFDLPAAEQEHADRP